MKRSLSGLLLALCALAACKDTPPGQLEPIPRPPDYQEPPKAEAPRPASEPAPDPNEAVLRWKLAADTPLAFRLEGTPTPEAPGARGLRIVYVLQRPQAGGLILRVSPESKGATPDQGTLSERGFVLDGLGGTDRNLATLLLELPKSPVAEGDTWSLGADFVDPTPLGPDFAQDPKASRKRNTVKLTALAPEGDERVATIEYDLHERISGTFPPGSYIPFELSKPPAAKAPASRGKGKGKQAHAPEEEAQPSTPGAISAEVTVTGRGEFLVKAGRWRSWRGTLTAKTDGYVPPSPEKGVAQLPAGSLELRLTPLDSVPAEPRPAAKK